MYMYKETSRLFAEKITFISLNGITVLCIYEYFCYDTVSHEVHIHNRLILVNNRFLLIRLYSIGMVNAKPV